MPHAHATDPLVGRVLKEAYRIERQITDGGMSLVYLAEQLSLNRYIVLKVLRPGFNDEDFIDLFLREARVYSQLNHPNVVSVIDFGRVDDVVFMAMEYMDGGTLTDIVEHHGLSLANILWVMEQVCSGVQAAHKHNIIHRDIKPSNIMVCKLAGDTTVAKVLDFGISKPLSEADLKHTRMGMVMGTPGFLAPEQISGVRDMDARVDVYALGAILYYLITGRKPYDGASLEIIMHRQLQQAPDPIQADAIFDPEAAKLQRVIFKAMSIDREHRYPDVISFWEDVLNHANAMQKISPNTEVANQPIASKYLFIFKRELVAGAEKVKTQKALMQLLKTDAKQIQRLFAKQRTIVAKDLSLEKAQRYEAIFKKAGAVGYIEEMENATRILPKKPSTNIPASLPSSSLLQPILAKDIPQASQKPDLPPSSSMAASAFHTHSSTESLLATNKAKPKRLWPLITSACTLLILITISAAVFYAPLRYSVLDSWHYSIKQKPMPRGISATEIKLGMSAALSGSARELGHSMRNGINAKFMAVNEAGGIHGRTLRLLPLDDGYEPQAALSNIEKFMNESDGVFAMLGNIGTPTAEAILPQALTHKFIVFGTFSGASLLRNDPPDRYVFNYRASYAEETSALIHYFVGIEKIAPENIAVFYQADSFGHDGLQGVKHALREYGIAEENLIEASYERNTTQVDDAVTSLSPYLQQIKAVVLISTYAASASFTQAMRAQGYRGKFANVSFVGARALLERLQEKGVNPEGIVISQVVPPFNSYATGVLKYRDAMDKYFPEEQQGFISLEGYIAATLLVEGLQQAGRYVTTESLIDVLESTQAVDLGIGESLSFSPSDHQASHRVWGTRITADASFEPIKLEEGEELHGHGTR